MKLTKSQFEVLSLLKKNGPMPTSATTRHAVVSGSCASGLQRRGLVKGLFLDDEYKVEITPAGETAWLAEKDRQAAV